MAMLYMNLYNNPVGWRMRKLFICTPVGLDSEKRVFSEKMRKEWKRGEKRLLGTGKVHMM